MQWSISTFLLVPNLEPVTHILTAKILVLVYKKDCPVQQHKIAGPKVGATDVIDLKFDTILIKYEASQKQWKCELAVVCGKIKNSFFHWCLFLISVWLCMYACVYCSAQWFSVVKWGLVAADRVWGWWRVRWESAHTTQGKVKVHHRVLRQCHSRFTTVGNVNASKKLSLFFLSVSFCHTQTGEHCNHK